MDKKKTSANSLKDWLLLSVIGLCITLIILYQGQSIWNELRAEPTAAQEIRPYLDYEPEFIEEE